ncbi:hypothetical protein AB0D49_34150 [Streptomyces sp. NPDC048290]|uniref:hypothetical protein n=1 Tax=Streptomyces sp. NPDC048290 TaxID=3155811 RepID=UPI00342661C7
MITTGIASRQGTRPLNADSATIHRLPGTPMTAAALVDGIGNTHAVVNFARTAAEVIARVGARRGPLLGILAAAEMSTAPPGVQVEDGVAVAAVASESGTTTIAWTGDSRIYGWTGSALVQRSTDQTMGTWLRRWGGTAVTLHTDDEPDRTVPTEQAARVLDDMARAALSRCSIATVPLLMIDDPLVILTSDGMHGQISPETLEDLVRQHAGGDPQALANALVAAATGDDSGYRDDATAVVIRRH